MSVSTRRGEDRSTDGATDLVEVTHRCFLVIVSFHGRRTARRPTESEHGETCNVDGPSMVETATDAGERISKCVGEEKRRLMAHARSPVDCCQCIKHERRKCEACQVEALPSFELDHMRIRVSAA